VDFPIDEWLVNQTQRDVWDDMDQLFISLSSKAWGLKLTRRFESNPEDGWSRILNTFLVAAGTDCLYHQLGPKRYEGLTGTNGYPE
jgi:hypothetical protein